jgi:hypothetical protein
MAVREKMKMAACCHVFSAVMLFADSRYFDSKGDVPCPI